MKQCYQCFKTYGNEYEVCPHCGYIESTPIAEHQYLPPGTMLPKRYLVGAAVGAGGLGITYAAWDKVLEQKVAVKE